MCYFPENIWNIKKNSKRSPNWNFRIHILIKSVLGSLYHIPNKLTKPLCVCVSFWSRSSTCYGFYGFSCHFVFVCSLSSYERSSTCYVGRLLWFLLPLHCDPLNCDDTNLCKSATFVQKSGRKMVLWKIEIIHGCFSTTLGVIFLERDMLNICYQLQDDFL